MNFNANVRLLGLFTTNFLFSRIQVPARSPLKRCRLSYLLPAAKQWIAGTILNRRHIGGRSEVGRRRSGSSLCLTLIFKPTLTLGQPYGNLRVVLWFVIGIFAFNYNVSLTSIELPGTLTTIENDAFTGCGFNTDTSFRHTIICLKAHD